MQGSPPRLVSWDFLEACDSLLPQDTLQPAHHARNVKHYGNYCKVHLPAFCDWWTVFFMIMFFASLCTCFSPCEYVCLHFHFLPGPREWYASLWRGQIKGERRITRAILTYSKNTLTLERSSKFYGLGSFSTYRVWRVSRCIHCVFQEMNLTQNIIKTAHMLLCSVLWCM